MIHCPGCNAIISILPDGLAACGKCHKFYQVSIKEIKNPPSPVKVIKK